MRDPRLRQRCVAALELEADRLLELALGEPRFARPVRIVSTPYHVIPEARRQPIIGSPPRLGHPQVQQSAPVVTPPARFADRMRQSAPVAAPRAQVATPQPQVATPHTQVAPPARFAERRAELVRSVAPVHTMPAPQVRASERPIGVGHSGAAQASGNRGGGWKHRS